MKARLFVLIVTLAAVACTVACTTAGMRMSVKKSSTLTPAKGVVLLSATRGPILTFATDLDGNIVWRYPFDTRHGKYEPMPIEPLPDGHLMVVRAAENGVRPCPTCGADNIIEEIDLAGNSVWRLTNSQLQERLTAAGIPIRLAQISHDVLSLPNGHAIVLVSDTKDVVVDGRKDETRVLGAALIDLDEQHNPVWAWDTFDHLDPNRHPYFDMPDWIHGNAVIYSPDDGNLIFSSRHQSWLMKIDYENGLGNGAVLWRLGYQGDFALTNGGPSDWFYGQHAPLLISRNSTGVFRIGVFDNGNGRVLDASGAMCGKSGKPACYSTVPIYEVDERTHQARLVWRDTLPFFSGAVGNIQVLENGDLWFDAGFIDKKRTVMREVTMEATPQTVLEIDVNRRVYRAYHLPAVDVKTSVASQDADDTTSPPATH